MSRHLVDILRPDGTDDTNGGVTSRHRGTRFFVLLVDEQPHEAEKDFDRLLILVRRTIAGQPYLHAEPAAARRAGMVGPMAGGSYCWSCDSHFRTEVNAYPIPVHDRFETTEKHEDLSS